MSVKIGVADGFRLEVDFAMEKQFFAEAGFELTVCNCKSEDEIIEQLADCQIHCTVAGPYNEKVLRALPQLKGIVRYGIGLDTINVPLATELGIQVCNEPAYCVEDVATHAFAMIMDLSRKLTFYTTELRRGNWGFSKGYAARRIENRTVGLVGFGAIARRLKEMLTPWNVKFLVYDPFLDEKAIAAGGAEKVEIHRLMEEADIISIHCPLTEETRHLFNAEAFVKMKPQALLVNTSRGPVIDTLALAQAINEGQIYAAALDVMEQEPISPEHPLCALSQVVLSPHGAHFSEESFLILRQSVAAQALQIARGERPAYLFNKSLWKD